MESISFIDKGTDKIIQVGRDVERGGELGLNPETHISSSIEEEISVELGERTQKKDWQCVGSVKPVQLQRHVT